MIAQPMNTVEQSAPAKGWRAKRGEVAHRGQSVTTAEFRRLWLDPSLTAKDVGRRLGIGGFAARKRAEARGLPPKPRHPRDAQRKVDPVELARMWRAGVPIADIARHFGCCDAQVKAHRRKQGLPPRPRGGVVGAISLDQYRAGMADAAARRGDLMCAMWRDGVRLSCIAAWVGWPQRRVKNFLRQAGAEARHPGYQAASISLEHWARQRRDAELAVAMRAVASAEVAAARAYWADQGRCAA